MCERSSPMGGTTGRKNNTHWATWSVNLKKKTTGGGFREEGITEIGVGGGIDINLVLEACEMTPPKNCDLSPYASVGL